MKRLRRYKVLLRWRRFAKVVRESRNDGLLKRAIMETGAVRTYEIRSGGWGPTFVDLELNDGFTLWSEDCFTSEALRKAAKQVYAYEVGKLLAARKKV